MSDLITDLQNATTGTRELDARVAVMLEPDGEEGTYFRHPFISEITDKDCRDGQYWKCAISGRSLRTAPHYTTAPEGLRILMDYVRERWPDASFGVDWCPVRQRWAVEMRGYGDCWHWIEGERPTDPAIALAIAILRAEESEE